MMAANRSQERCRHADRCRTGGARGPASGAAGEVPAPAEERPTTPGRGIHHAALICSDVEQTIQFYQDLLGFPLVELVENRDYQGSSHFFFDLGNQTLLGFFDFPGLGPRAGGRGDRQRAAHRHLRAGGPLGGGQQAAGRGGRAYLGPDRGIAESMYFKDPDGIQIELLSDPLMYFAGKQLDE